MAELIVKARCQSVLRDSVDNFLNMSFPIWGLLGPALSVILALVAIGYMQTAQAAKVTEMLACSTFCACLSILSLFTKRAIGLDSLTIDRQGIHLPFFIGMQLNLTRYLSWKDVENVSSLFKASDPKQARFLIKRKRGGTLTIPVSQLPADFAEQFILAVSMWSPQQYDPSLEQMQSQLRLGTSGQDASSYTEIWEEELSRRFCPTSYMPLELGKVLRNSSLKVVKHLSSGGLSALYLCQLDGNKLVVLKEAVAPQQSPENIKEKARELFEREAKLLMKLDHPGVVKVLDYFCEEERNYLMLEYINGIDLRQLVKQNGPQKEMDVLEWAIQIAATLKHLHERDPAIIHRDLTPDNIVMRNDGKLIVVDFGAANEFIGTATGTFVGKHSYIAPEQLRGKANISSDIYAFGCTLFYLLCGRDPEALLPSNAKEANPEISSEFSELIESCTQLEANDRYQSVAQLLPVLRRLSAQSMVT